MNKNYIKVEGNIFAKVKDAMQALGGTWVCNNRPNNVGDGWVVPARNYHQAVKIMQAANSR